MFLNGVVDDHELLYPLQDGETPLHLAAKKGHTTWLERLLFTPGIVVNIKNVVSWYRCRMGRQGRVGGGILGVEWRTRRMPAVSHTLS